MYGQSHQQGQNAFMNGGGHGARYGMNLNMSKPFQSAQHQSTAQQHRQQEHGNSGPGANGNFASHQHNSSASAFSTGPSQHFNPSQIRNNTPSHQQLNGLGRPPNEQWAQQLTLYQQSREATGTHIHARNHPNSKSGGGSQSLFDQSKKDGDKEEQRHRPPRLNAAVDVGVTWHELDMSGQGLRALAPTLFNYPFLRKLYLNNNKLTYLPPLVGRLRNLTLLDLSQNVLGELPAEVGMLVNLKSLLLFDNHLDTLPYELGSLFQLDMLGIEGNPINDDLKTIMMHDGTKALIQYLQDSSDPPEPPTERDWIIVDESRASNSGAAQDKFTVMGYNCLAPMYATHSLYGYTPVSALAWDHRKNVILDEIRAREADIVCLQEVSMENFHDFFRPTLAHNDYKGVYHPRTRSKTMSEKDSRQVDGCAVFFKNSKYVLLEKQNVEFAHDAINRPDMKGEAAIFDRVMQRDHVAVILFLENRQTGSRIIVVNAHIFWDPVFIDVKIVQVAVLLERVTLLAEQWSKVGPCKDKTLYRYADSDTVDPSEAKPPAPEPGPSLEYAAGTDIPVVVCTDLNSLPDSSICQLLSTGRLAADHEDLRPYKYGKFTREGISHPFPLKSAYGTIGELSFTNYTPGFTEVVDYIWYNSNALHVTGLLGEVDKQYLQRVPGFPNYHFPSDHLALLAEFVVKPQRKNEQQQQQASPFPLQQNKA